MERGLSLYLDLLRLAAAAEVLAYHLSGFSFVGGHRVSWNSYGHEAVTIFFVLSGFVICHAATTRDRTLTSFAVSRFTRVYSVAVPCLLLTLAFDVAGHYLAPGFYAGLSPAGSPALRLAIGAAMLNEAWVSVQMLSNTPYWSISYEFWYYALFGALFYLKGAQRWLVAALCALVAGPKILLLFPIWIMGWAAYSERKSITAPLWAMILLFVQPVMVFALYEHFQLAKLGGELLQSALGYQPWRIGMAWSRFVLSDSLLGASVALHLIGAKRVGATLRPVLMPIESIIRFGADRSFTLYLLHQPAIIFMAACLATLSLGDMRPYAVALGTIVIVLVVAIATEGQRRHIKPIVAALIQAVVGLGEKRFGRWQASRIER